MKKIQHNSDKESLDNLKITELNLTPEDLQLLAGTLGGETISPNERLEEVGAKYLKKLS